MHAGRLDFGAFFVVFDDLSPSVAGEAFEFRHAPHGGIESRQPPDDRPLSVANVQVTEFLDIEGLFRRDVEPVDAAGPEQPLDGKEIAQNAGTVVAARHKTEREVALRGAHDDQVAVFRADAFGLHRRSLRDLELVDLPIGVASVAPVGGIAALAAVGLVIDGIDQAGDRGEQPGGVVAPWRCRRTSSRAMNDAPQFATE